MPATPILNCLRTATAEIHIRLERRANIVARLCNSHSRANLLWHYAALHIPLERALTAQLQSTPGLEFGRRCRASRLSGFLGSIAPPEAPKPLDRSEALGMLYVLEGSTLGGKSILRQLAERGVVHLDLEFLDPYGNEAGAMWQGLLAVLDREIGTNAAFMRAAATGARRAFLHAETLFCGDCTFAE